MQNNGHKVALNSTSIDSASSDAKGTVITGKVAMAAKKVNDALEQMDDQSKTFVVPPEQVKGFEIPAPIVNNFQIFVAPNYARLVATEIDPNQQTHIRAGLAMDYPTLVKLHEMLGSVISNALRPKDQDAKAANDQKTEVGE